MIALQHRQEQIFLVPEVIVQRSVGHPASLRDVADRHAGVALLAK
jgi:hypothetical protein